MGNYSLNKKERKYLSKLNKEITPKLKEKPLPSEYQGIEFLDRLFEVSKDDYRGNYEML